MNNELLKKMHASKEEEGAIKRVFLRTKMIEKEMNMIFVNIGGS